jgi:PDZ domain-containing secreted protein
MKILVAVVMITLLSMSVALAQQDMVVKIKSVDAAGKAIVLEDGTKIMIPDSAKVTITELKPGQSVKLSYEEKDGQKTAKTITIQP